MAGHRVTFVTHGSATQVEVEENQYLLEAANAAGLELPYMCLQGWCTTCAGRVLEGKVDQSEARRIFPQDEAAGFVLLCSAFARSDLHILTHQKEPCASIARRSACRRHVDDMMTPLGPETARLFQGPLLETGLSWPMSMTVRLCDLRPRFLPKCRVGRGFRAVARNGRVLLASDRPLEDLDGRTVRLRFQTWHRSILEGDMPSAYGLALCVRSDQTSFGDEVYAARLLQAPADDFDLFLDVGGLRGIEFRRGASS